MRALAYTHHSNRPSLHRPARSGLLGNYSRCEILGGFVAASQNPQTRQMRRESPDSRIIVTDVHSAAPTCKDLVAEGSQTAAAAGHFNLIRMWNEPAHWGRPDDKKKTLPEQWHLHKTNWRYLNALVPYLGPPTNTLAHIWFPLLSVMMMSVMIKLVDGHIAWSLDKQNFALTLYRSSSFVLSLLLAFRLVGLVWGLSACTLKAYTRAAALDCMG